MGKLLRTLQVLGIKKLTDFLFWSLDRMDRMLYFPKLCNGTAVKMSEAVIDCMDEWGLRDRIKGTCFDTTASNAGTKGGVCLRLQKEIGRELLNLACRLHISKIILE